jgi:hypothetical protein
MQVKDRNMIYVERTASLAIALGSQFILVALLIGA